MRETKCSDCGMTFQTEGGRRLHMLTFHPKPVSIPIGRKFERIVAKIEKCFYAYQENNQNHLSFTQIKDWINDNTKNGISSPRLANFLRRRPQFKMVKKYRKVGTNLTESYWALTSDDTDSCVGRSKGWVEVQL